MVAPERETPGHEGEALHQPDHQGVGEGQLALAAVLGARAARRQTITALQSTSEAPTHHSERSGPEMTFAAQEADHPDRQGADDDEPAVAVVERAAVLRSERAP